MSNKDTLSNRHALEIPNPTKVAVPPARQRCIPAKIKDFTADWFQNAGLSPCLLRIRWKLLVHRLAPSTFEKYNQNLLDSHRGGSSSWVMSLTNCKLQTSCSGGKSLWISSTNAFRDAKLLSDFSLGWHTVKWSVAISTKSSIPICFADAYFTASISLPCTIEFPELGLLALEVPH